MVGTLVLDPKIDTKGTITINYDFSGVPSPSTGPTSHTIFVNDDSFSVAVDSNGDGSINVAESAFLKIGGAVTGNNLHETFAQQTFLATF